jgi:hypothetical protein
MAARPMIEGMNIIHSPRVPEKITISKYIMISKEPIKAIKLVRTLVKNLSFSQLPSTMKLMNIADRMKGKGTTDPGDGTQAVLLALISYPAGQSNLTGTHPSAVLFISKFLGHTSPSNLQAFTPLYSGLSLCSLLGEYFVGQYWRHLVFLKRR